MILGPKGILTLASYNKTSNIVLGEGWRRVAYDKRK